MKKSTISFFSNYLFFLLSLILLINSRTWGSEKTINKNQSVNKANAANVGNIIIKKWADDKKSAFSFSFDDGFQSQYINVRPILNQFGFKGTFYLIAGSINDNYPAQWRYGIWSQFLDMVQEGHEMASHTMTHPHLPQLNVGTKTTPGTIEYELYQSKKIIEGKTGQDIISFAYPYTEHNTTIDNITSQSYVNGRAMGDFPNSSSLSGNEWYGLTAKQPEFNLPRNTVNDDLDELQEYENYLISSISNKKWTIFFGHEVVPFANLKDSLNDMYLPISNEWLTAFTQWVKNKSDNNDIWVETVGNVTRYIKERDNFFFNIVSSTSSQIVIQVDDGLDNNIFNYPLTTDIVVPNNWTNVAFTQGNVTETLTPFTNNGVNYIRAKVIPGAGNVIVQNTATLFTITSSSGANGSITPPGAVSVTSGGSKIYTITPNTGYKISSITVDGNPVTVTSEMGQTYTFTNVTADHTISATFSKIQYTITASASANGAISPNGSVSVDYGSSKSFTITPNTGYKIKSITVDGNPETVTSETGQTYTFTNVTANHTISATFSKIQYTITASASANGAISPNGSVSVDYDSSKSFTITPNTGYKIGSITVDGNPVAVTTPSSQTYTFTNVTANHTISATFSKIQYTITASVSANGAISPNGSVSVGYGSSKSFTITPNTGYKIGSITVDGNPVAVTTPSQQTYTFNNVTTDHVISASFNADVIYYSFSGKILYNNTSNSPLQNVTLKLTSSNTTVEATTNSAGEFIFNNLLPGTYQIVLSTTNTWGGVNSTDALRTVRVFTNLDTFINIQKKAADVNNDGSINSTDALLIVRRFANLITSFAISDWVYDAPASVTISNQNKTLVIKALASGDVDGSRIP